MNQTTPIDSTGNNTPLAGVNVALVSTGLNGDVLDFSSGRVDMGAAILPLGDFTQSAWINPDALGSFQGVLGNWFSGQTGRTYFGTSGTAFRWDGYNTSGIQAGTLVNGTWVFISVTRTGSAISMAINGVEVNTETDSGTPNTAQNTFIGGLTGGTNNFFDGRIGENRLSNNFSSGDRLLTEVDNRLTAATWWTSSAYGEGGGGSATIPVIMNQLRNQRIA